MSRDTVQEITNILRRDILRGSSRTIHADHPLGEGGIGLDSLALVELITALENHFDIDIPEGDWVNRGQLTLAALARIVESQIGADTPPAPRPVRPEEDIEHGTRLGRTERLRNVLQEQGVLASARWIASRAVKKTADAAFQQRTFYILAADLTSPLPAVDTLDTLAVFRLAELPDAVSLDGIYSPSERQYKLTRFKERLAAGYHCYTAWIDGRLAAIDWVTDKTDHEPTTGLTIEVGPGACYGLDLREHPDFKSRGVGLALLSHCLADCRRRGYHTQFAVVDATNRRMLMASVQLLGFRNVGYIWTRTVLGTTTTKWECSGRSGSDAHLRLFR